MPLLAFAAGALLQIANVLSHFRHNAAPQHKVLPRGHALPAKCTGLKWTGVQTGEDIMNWMRLAAAAIAAWIVSIGLGYLVNNVLLAGLYQANQTALRANADIMPMLPIGFAATFVGFFVLSYAFAKGYEGGNGTMEGVRFGFMVGVLLACFAVVWEYVVFPIQAAMSVAMIVDTLIEYTIYGAIIGTIYKPRAAATAAA
jgi:hypothetical protein